MAFCLLLCWGDSQLENLHLCSDSSRSLVRPANIVFSCMCNCFFLIEKHYNYCFYLIVHFFFLFVILFVSSHCFPIFLNGKIFFFFFSQVSLWKYELSWKACNCGIFKVHASSVLSFLWFMSWEISYGYSILCFFYI